MVSVLIELIKNIPVAGADLRPFQMDKVEAGARHFLALTAQILAFAGTEAGQKVIKILITLISPVKLVGFAANQAVLLPVRGFVRLRKQYMPRTGALPLGLRGYRLIYTLKNVIALGCCQLISHKYPGRRAGRVGDGGHEFGIVRSAV